jgi:hypothetical protein
MDCKYSVIVCGVQGHVLFRVVDGFALAARYLTTCTLERILGSNFYHLNPLLTFHKRCDDLPPRI